MVACGCMRFAGLTKVTRAFTCSCWLVTSTLLLVTTAFLRLTNASALQGSVGAALFRVFSWQWLMEGSLVFIGQVIHYSFPFLLRDFLLSIS